jgi:hypothetical protein
MNCAQYWNIYYAQYWDMNCAQYWNIYYAQYWDMNCAQYWNICYAQYWDMSYDITFDVWVMLNIRIWVMLNIGAVIIWYLDLQLPIQSVPITSDVVSLNLRTRWTTLCDKVCQWLATDLGFSLGPPVSSTNKTDRHDITEILLKVALNTIKQTNKQTLWL